MAIKEGRCPNCGSLLMVEDKDPKGVCMFCNARFAPVRAVQLAADPGDAEFPNEPQESLTDEERQLAFRHVRSVQPMAAPAVTKSQPAPKKAKTQPGKLTPAQKVALQKKELIEPRVSKQHKTQMLAVVAGVLVLLTAVFLPLTLRRVARKAALSERINDIAVMDVPGEDYFDFTGFRNTSLLLVSDEEVTEEEAAETMENYRTVRAEVYGLENADNQPDLVIRIAAPNGSFLVDADGVSQED